MARIEGVDIPRDKRTEIALTYIHGIGSTTAQNLVEHNKIDRQTRVKDLADAQVEAIRQTIKEWNLEVEGDLRRKTTNDIKRKMEIGSNQGIRHRKGLPVRGQRTQTNARTRKGPKKTVAGKKQVTK